MGQTAENAPAAGWRPNDTLALRVKLVRDRLGDSQRAFALRTGLTFGEVQSLEGGAAVRKAIEKVQKIATTTGVDQEWLMFGGALPRLDSNQEPTGTWLPTLTVVGRKDEAASRSESTDGLGVTNGTGDGRMDAGDGRLLRLAEGERRRAGSAADAAALPAATGRHKHLRAVVAHA